MPEAPRLARPAPGHTCDLFFAVQPEPKDAERIGAQADAVRQALGLRGGAVIGPPRLHVSLRGLGSYDAPPEALLRCALAAAASVRLAPFEVTFDQLMSFGRANRQVEARPLVWTNTHTAPDWQALHQRLGIALADAGVSIKPAFQPHMSLSWHKAWVQPQACEPLRWTARRFVLIWSHVKKTRYERAGEWPLTA